MRPTRGAMPAGDTACASVPPAPYRAPSSDRPRGFSPPGRARASRGRPPGRRGSCRRPFRSPGRRSVRLVRAQARPSDGRRSRRRSQRDKTWPDARARGTRRRRCPPRAPRSGARPQCPKRVRGKEGAGVHGSGVVDAYEKLTTVANSTVGPVRLRLEALLAGTVAAVGDPSHSEPSTDGGHEGSPAVDAVHAPIRTAVLRRVLRFARAITRRGIWCLGPPSTAAACGRKWGTEAGNGPRAAHPPRRLSRICPGRAARRAADRRSGHPVGGIEINGTRRKPYPTMAGRAGPGTERGLSRLAPDQRP